MHRNRPRLLWGVLLILAVGYLVVSLSRSPIPSKAKPLFSSKEEIAEFIEGQSIALPDGRSLVIHRDQVKSLRIEPAPEANQVTFELGDDGERYAVNGYMSLHYSDGTSYPMVNLGLGWYVSKKSK